MNCDAARRTVLLSLYGEVGEDDRRAGQAHIAACAACARIEAEERRLHAILSERDAFEPSDALLDRCRRDLARALDGEPAPRLSWTRRLHGFWMEARLSPAYGLALVAAGFLAGVVALRLLPGLGGASAGPAPIAAAGIPGAAVPNVLSLDPAPEGDRVRVSYDTLQRSQIEGSPADPEIRALLLTTVRDSLNAGLRLGAIEALRRQTEDEGVRQALIRALREDENAGARLRVIEALHERVAADAEVRHAMLEAVRSDANPGVRIRAIDVLSHAHAPEMLPAMEQLAREDPDAYVRLRSAAFVDAVRVEDRR